MTLIIVTYKYLNYIQVQANLFYDITIVCANTIEEEQDVI